MVLTIGQVAKSTGIGAKTIRFYEAAGVLPAPTRTVSGYRQLVPLSPVAMRTGLTIGKLAARSGVRPKTIRFYEFVGVIPSRPRARRPRALTPGPTSGKRGTPPASAPR